MSKIFSVYKKTPFKANGQDQTVFCCSYKGRSIMFNTLHFEDDSYEFDDKTNELTVNVAVELTVEKRTIVKNDLPVEVKSINFKPVMDLDIAGL